VLFTVRATGGKPTPSRESREVLWVDRDKLVDLQMDRSMRMRIEHYLDNRPTPHLG
jgi:hypothetical protein